MRNLFPFDPEIDGLRTDPEKLGRAGTFHGRSSVPSLNGSGEGQTEEGETGAAHFIGTTGGLPSDAEATGFVGFCGCSGCFRQAQGIPHAKLQFLISASAIGEPPYLCCRRIQRSLQQVNDSHEVYRSGCNSSVASSLSYLRTRLQPKRDWPRGFGDAQHKRFKRFS
jgi:hypothetical protein